MHFCDLSFKVERSARFPNTKAKPPKTMDFPAPVSPVRHDNPLEKFTSKWSIKAKLRIESSVNTYYDFRISSKYTRTSALRQRKNRLFKSFPLWSKKRSNPIQGCLNGIGFIFGASRKQIDNFVRLGVKKSLQQQRIGASVV